MSEPIFGLLPSGPVPDPGLQRATNHVERAIGVLLSQMRDKATFTRLLDILVRPLQECEDVAWSLLVDRRIDTSVGMQLDVIGKIVQEPRAGLGDTDYRAVLRVKGRVLRSKGLADDLLEIAALMLKDNATVFHEGQFVTFFYEEFYPASVRVTVPAPPVFSPGLLFKFLQKAKMGGVRLETVVATDTDSFTFNGDTSLVTDIHHGFGDSTTPTTGGHFVDLH